MIAGFKQYPAMKDSGVEWLGDVPAHWEVRRLRNVANIQFSNVDKHSKDGETTVRLCNYSDVYYNDRIRSGMNFMSATATAEEIRRFRLVAGDVLITKDSESWDDIGVPAFVENSANDLVCGYHLALLRPNSGTLAGEFLQRALSCRGIADQFFVRANGVTRFGLSQAAIKSCSLPVPPLPEQTAIARFLDQVTDRIDRYIRAKEKLIALLEEKKQAIVQDAVTGRIHVCTGKPYQTYKPSGLEWLGEIPVHWQVVRNGQIFVQRNEVGFPDLPILEVSLTTGVRVRDFENSIRKQVMSDRNLYKRAVKDDIAYNMMRMWQGAVGVAPVDGLVSPAYVVAKPREGTEPRYFDYLFRTGTYLIEVDKHSRGIVKDRNRLYWEDFKQMPTPRPPTNEQVLIADAVDRKVRLTQEAIRNARQQIILANELRTGLINDIVTGKFDVREAAGALPVKSRTQNAALDDVEGGAANQEEATVMTDWNTCPAVERKPGRVSGAWVFAGTRIPLSALYENLAGGATVDEFVEWFPGVDEKQVREVLRHEAHALKTALAR